MLGLERVGHASLLLCGTPLYFTPPVKTSLVYRTSLTGELHRDFTVLKSKREGDTD